MKFVYCGYDFLLSAVQHLLRDGHELTGLFTFECDNVFNFNHEIIALAQSKNAPVILSKPQNIHIENFLGRGTEIFIAGGYPYKIPPIDETRAYGINIHPSLLPKGRGIMPTPHIIISQPEAAGVSIHKLTSIIDDGDILVQQALPLSKTETVDIYSARIQATVPDMLSKIMADLPRYWKNATPQNRDEISYFPIPDEALRTLDWTSSIQKIDATVRAFGRFGSMAFLGDKTYIVTQCEVWPEKHIMKPGTIALKENNSLIVAALDGFVRLKNPTAL